MNEEQVLALIHREFRAAGIEPQKDERYPVCHSADAWIVSLARQALIEVERPLSDPRHAPVLNTKFIHELQKNGRRLVPASLEADEARRLHRHLKDHHYDGKSLHRDDWDHR